MRIAIDARELMGKPTGVGRYLASLLTEWAQLPAAAAHQFVLCAPGPLDHPCTQAPNVSVIFSPDGGTGQVPQGGSRPEGGRQGGTMWQQLTLPRLVRAAKADLVFAPAYSGPLAVRTPMVVSVHDVSFVAHPEWFSRREGLQRRVIGRWSARRATRILTFSDFSKREIVRAFGVDAGRVEVIYHGVTAFTGRAIDAQESAPARAPLILYAGSIFNRRHIPEVIDAFSRLADRHPGVRLELVGENRTLPFVDVTALIAASAVRDRIQARSYVSDAELAALYAAAAAFVFCSDYEGFGLTPLEALAAGIPIVVLDTEVTREIYGPAARYVSAPDPASIAAALEAVLFDADERARILRAAASVLGRYSWRESAQRTLQALLASV